jgi:hypothetical protein
MTSAFYLPQDEYLARISMYDSSNQPIAKLRAGEKYGERFDELYWNLKKFASPKNGGHQKMLVVGDQWDSRSWGCSLEKASDLFLIKKPGHYHLKIEIQIMLLYLDTKGKQTRQIVQFPPVEVQLLCPAGLEAH